MSIESRCLVLNRHFVPVGICSVKEAFKLICQDADSTNPSKGPLAWVIDAKAQPYDLASWMALPVEEGMDSIGMVNSRVRVPRVIRLATFNKVPKTVVKFSRMNVMTRDEFTCCYCNERKPIRMLSMDHVLPRSKGGDTSWGNIVTACTRCNQQKADRTPDEAGMTLLRTPHRPSWSHLHTTTRGKQHEEWDMWLVKSK